MHTTSVITYLGGNMNRRTPIFIAALLTIAKTWKDPKCSLTEEWTKDVVHTHNGILCSHQNNETPFATTWLQLEILV